MTAGIVLRCDGTPADRPNMALERCRAFLPTPALSPIEARPLAAAGGWTSRIEIAGATRRRIDLCPACSPTPKTTPVTEPGRVHTSVGVVDHAAESRVNVITTWTPSTPLAQAEETIKAASRQAVDDVRARFRDPT